jgi:trk system potassium uptake protein TrkH
VCLGNGEDFAHALTHATFNVVSIVTTTGYASADYTLWGPLPVALLFVATFLGGCSGSTSGGIKAYRLVIIASSVRSGLMRLIYPERDPAGALWRGGGRTGHAANGVSLRLRLYGNLGTWVRSRFPPPGSTSKPHCPDRLQRWPMSARASARMIGPSGNFSSIGDAGKMIMVFLMLLGRLEILAVLVLLSRPSGAIEKQR